MRIRVLILTTFFISPFVIGEELYVSERNFLQFPNYKEIDELPSLPSDKKCEDTECFSYIIANKRYFKTYLLTSSNYEKVAIGTWTGGSCSNDRWEMRQNGTFQSQYPLDEGVYLWKGKFQFTDSLYIEDAINNDNKKEWNEAKLYYLPKFDVIIYKGTRSLDGYDESGKKKYTYYEGPDFYYFKRCEVPYAS